ncbi:hypothetical protein Taro_030650 [Colocasia esculenta]|uniref:Uncharacterized protein n=1 Tax=Colocasia esculenta TaxID=4460 RepID=A0A843VLX1_COLES|nr:hypothetical protein [Colocasia esculenta]
MGMWQCGPQEWCWLVSTVSWLVLVERQLDLSFVAVRVRGSPVWFVRVRESRRLLALLLVRSYTVAELGLHHQQCNLLSLYTSGYAPGRVVLVFSYS